MYPFYYNDYYAQNFPYYFNNPHDFPSFDPRYLFPPQNLNYALYSQVGSGHLSPQQKTLELSFTLEETEKELVQKLVKVRQQQKNQRIHFNLMKIRRIKKKKRLCERELKENRNTYSNILRNFFKKINDWTGVKDLVNKIIKNKNLSLNLMEFQQYTIENRVDHSRYICLKNITYLFENQENLQESLIFRVLFAIYLNRNALIQILTSKKIGKISLRTHIDGIRQLKQRIFNQD